jgi:hypothetical protein
MVARNASANDGILFKAFLLPALSVLADLTGEGFFPKSADNRKAGLRPWRVKAKLWPAQPCAWSGERTQPALPLVRLVMINPSTAHVRVDRKDDAYQEPLMPIM